MHIIVEGPDASGKSTLVDWLQDQTGFNVQRSEGPEKFPGETDERIQNYLSFMEPTIFDRHPAISEPIYSSFRETPVTPDPSLVEEVYASCDTIIYCRNGDLTKHEINPELDTPEHLELITENYDLICATYDRWAMVRADKIYRIGQDYGTVYPTALPRDVPYNSIYEDVCNFHNKFNLPIYKGLMPAEAQFFRTGFMKEEFNEYRGAIRGANKLEDHPELRDKYLADAFDAVIDLIYVALGTAVMHGFDFQAGWDRVHAANMKKVRATEAEQSKRGTTLDVIKPEGWEAPSLIDLI